VVAAFTLLLLSNAWLMYFFKLVLDKIESLNLYTHLVTLDLLFPANVGDFVSQLFPLITFDLIPTEYIYPGMFKTDQITDEPLTAQLADVGYNGKLVINNLGSLLLIMFI
jgi:hypothetical protein